jgi:hypothetical protein
MASGGVSGESGSFCHTLALAAMALLGSCSKPEEKPLRVATLPRPGFESMHLGQSLGYF